MKNRRTVTPLQPLHITRLRKHPGFGDFLRAVFGYAHFEWLVFAQHGFDVVNTHLQENEWGRVRGRII